MFGYRAQTAFADDETAGAWGWKRSCRARRRERARAEAELISDLRWQWRSACMATSLSQIIYTPSGTTRGVPKIGHIELGPPISFTVQMRPGQRFEDFVATAPSIAPAMDAAALEITPLVPHWLRVVLVGGPLTSLHNRTLEPEGQPLG